MDPSKLAESERKLRESSIAERLAWAREHGGGKIAFATSLGAEDQMLLDCVEKAGLLHGTEPLEVFTLDTGRLFPETLALLAETEARYQIRIKVYCPEAQDVEDMVNEGGINLFRNSVKDRERCCAVRKLAPLLRALEDKTLWMVGLRRQQSEYRADLPLLSWDEGRGLLKLCPLADVSDVALLQYLDEHQVPINPLHRAGYPSIGCAPCTRSVCFGEDPRAGRWWWERESKRECGLHVVQGRLVRIL